MRNPSHRRRFCLDPLVSLMRKEQLLLLFILSYLCPMPGQSIELKSQFSRILFQAVLCRHAPPSSFLILLYYRHLRLEGKIHVHCFRRRAALLCLQQYLYDDSPAHAEAGCGRKASRSLGELFQRGHPRVVVHLS